LKCNKHNKGGVVSFSVQRVSVLLYLTISCSKPHTHTHTHTHCLCGLLKLKRMHCHFSTFLCFLWCLFYEMHLLYFNQWHEHYSRNNANTLNK